MKIAVIGAGAMGRWSVKALGLSPEVDMTIVADYDVTRATQVAAESGGGKAMAVQVDASDEEAVAAVIEGCDALVNATQHFWNLTVMHAAARSGVHYTDMGGLFHVTRQQLELDAEFGAAGVTAVISMGGAPGVTNILARYGADRLDTIEEVQALCGNVDNTDWSGYDGWFAPYSLETICDEFSVPAPSSLTDSGAKTSSVALALISSTSVSQRVCCRRTTRSTPNRSPSGMRGRIAACAPLPGSWRFRRASPTRCAFSPRWD